MQALGIDISSTSHVCCLLSEQGAVMASFQQPNTVEGIRRIAKRLPQGTILCFEPTGPYSKLLIAILGNEFALHQLNTDQVRSGSTSMNRTKTDERDARVIAQAGMRLAKMEPKALEDARVRWSPVHEDRLLLVSEYERLKDEVLRRNAQLEALRANPAKATSAISARIRAEIAGLETSVVDAKREIEQHISDDEDAQLLLSIPGIGCLNAAAFTAKIGDVNRFRDADALKCYVGLFPQQQKSGHFVGRARMAKNGCALLRHLLWNAARVAAKHNPVCRALFERLRARGKHTAAAYGAVARKLVQIIYGILRTRRPFENILTT